MPTDDCRAARSAKTLAARSESAAAARSESAAAAMLRQFHARYAPVTRPPSDRVRTTRQALMAEEYQEYEEAEARGDLVKIADALADMVYIAYGTALCYGIDLDAVLAEVHDSNMTKDPSATAAGKPVKGSRYRPPDIERILRSGN